MRRAGLIALLGCALMLGAMAPAAAQETSDPRATERRLDRARAELDAIAAQRRKLEGERGAAARALRKADEQVGATARELADLQRQVRERTATLAELGTRREALTDRLAQQRESLAALLRAAHALGEHAPLKLLLAQDRVADGQRLLAYHGYLQRERARRIGQLATELQSLAALQAKIDAERVALEAAQVAQQQKLEALERDRTARAGTVAQLENRYRTRTEREQSIGRDVKSLERLLASLREAAARAARERAAQERAARERALQERAAQERAARERAAQAPTVPGQPAPAPVPLPPPPPAAVVAAATGPSVGGLGWPVAGTLLAGFGAKMPDGRRSDGVLIAADAGRDVVASAGGRVVFADWMTGYGLIVIVDHGGDTMSLYANNDTLLRDVGDTVAKGDPVAKVGSSGGQGRPALYFELRRAGKPVDPRSWFATQR